MFGGGGNANTATVNRLTVLDLQVLVNVILEKAVRP